MKPIRVAVRGALGRMGREIVNALCQEPETQVVGAVEMQIPEKQLSLPDGSGTVPLSSDLARILSTCHPEVLVDFTTAKAVMSAVHLATEKRVNLVIGTRLGWW